MNMLFKNRHRQLQDFHRLLQPQKKDKTDEKKAVCPGCGKENSLSRLKAELYVCPACGHHMRISARERIRQLTDEKSFREMHRDMAVAEPEEFRGYSEKLTAAQRRTGLKDSVITGTATINGTKCAIAVMDSFFMMGSMGSVTGEKITLLTEYATKKKLPLIISCCSGGARMQEGIISLFQMSKTAAALKKFSEKGGLYISLLTHPTTGGVSASFAMLGDIIIAEPGALVGFAGKRVIEKTINRQLPDNFQTAEFVQEKGFVDIISHRHNLKTVISGLLKLHSDKNRKELTVKGRTALIARQATVQQKGNMTPWQRVQIARGAHRPKAQDYIERLFDDFYPLHGDRLFGDDNALSGGIATFHGIPVTVLAQCKGRNLEENVKNNFGMMNPEGYRKALRLAKQAEKFHRPVITFVDTAGAYPGIGAEERGQAEAIARCLMEFSDLKTPVIAIVLSEGGSGGALALSVADRIAMLENAVYSVLSPEGFASILWKDASKAPQAARSMKLTADDLMEKGLIDEIIRETAAEGADSVKATAAQIDRYLCTQLTVLLKKKTNVLCNERYQKYRRTGTTK